MQEALCAGAREAEADPGSSLICIWFYMALCLVLEVGTRVNPIGSVWMSALVSQILFRTWNGC